MSAFIFVVQLSTQYKCPKYLWKKVNPEQLAYFQHQQTEFFVFPEQIIEINMKTFFASTSF